MSNTHMEEGSLITRRTRLVPLGPEWDAFHRQHITLSSIALLVNPYKPKDVENTFWKFTGDARYKDPVTPYVQSLFDAGHQLEPHALRHALRYIPRLRLIEYRGPMEVLQHRSVEIGATPDAFVVDLNDPRQSMVPLEIKTRPKAAGVDFKWEYAVQVLVQAWLYDSPYGLCYVYNDRERSAALYRVEADTKLVVELLDAAAFFWSLVEKRTVQFASEWQDGVAASARQNIYAKLLTIAKNVVLI